MTHETVLHRLDDFVEGALPPAERSEVETHLRGCPECAAEAAALRKILEGARGLARGTEPSRDLWPGIAEEIGAAPVRAARPVRTGRGIRAAWGWGLAAAAAVAVAGALGVMLLRGPRTSFVEPERPAPVESASAAARRSVEPVVTALDAQCAAAGQELVAALKTGGGVLDARAAVVVEGGLSVLDGAIAQSMSAWRAHPDDPELIYRLTGLYRQKLQLLREAADLAGGRLT